MGEVLFYHLTSSVLEQTLPDLLERSLQRGWRAVVRAPSAARINALDEHLWRYRPDSFLPHGTAAMDHADQQPVFLTDTDDIPNAANILMLVDGARLQPEEAAGFERTCLIFNGNEPAAVEAAREDWRALQPAGLTGKYWAQDGGRWVEKAST
ncbi:DNA polymerase III subunit chi [Halovulum sp. GXIMD14793]